MSKTNGQPKPDSPPKLENGWVKLYSPRGPQVTLPVTTERLDYAAMLANVHAMLDAGWLVAAPGLEEGEQKEEVGWVLHGEHERDGEITPFVLLYANGDQLTWSFLKVYLNKPADVAAFEYASRMELAKVPLYNGQDKPQRGVANKTDKFIIRAPKPFHVIFKPNPKHDPATEEGKMKPARLFVRWQDQPPAQKPEPQPDGQPEPQLSPDAYSKEFIAYSNSAMMNWKARLLRAGITHAERAGIGKEIKAEFTRLTDYHQKEVTELWEQAKRPQEATT